MTTSITLLYDKGRPPLWLRIALLAFGLLMLWLGIAIAATGLFGVRWINGHGSSLLGSLACFLLAALFIFVWFGQLQILFDEARQELVVRTRGYTRIHERRISLIGGREIHMRHVSMIGGSWWEVTVEFSDGRSEHVARIKSDIETLVQSLEACVKLPVRRFMEERPLNQKSNREIVSSTVACASICIFLIVMNILLLIRHGNLLTIIWGTWGTIFVLAVLLACILPAVRELRRRRRKTQNQDRGPSA